MSEGCTSQTTRSQASGTGTCQSNTHWDGEFTCPVVMVHRAGATLVDNVFTASGSADGIRATGALLNVQRNTWNLNSQGAVLQNFDTGAAGAQQYGTLAFFTENLWNGVTSTYNVTKSSVTVQSETIPDAPAGKCRSSSHGTIKKHGRES